MSTVNEALVREVVAEVLGRLGGSATQPKPVPAGCLKAGSVSQARWLAV